MARSTWLGAIAVTALLLTGCAGAAAPQPSPAPSHTMPDGSVMSGAEHEGHETEPSADDSQADDSHDAGVHESGADAPSPAAEMVCAGQVVTAVTATFRLDDQAASVASWDAPDFTCTYDVEGSPLVLTVHDATDVAAGEQHYAGLQQGLGAEDIDGLLGLGLPSFSTGEGVVGFLRDGKTLTVDATALPAGFAGDMTRDEAAYAIATAVLGCWVEHD